MSSTPLSPTGRANAAMTAANVNGRKGAKRADADRLRASQGFKLGFYVGAGCENFAGEAQQLLTSRRHRHLALASVQKLLAKLFFELADRSRDSRLRDSRANSSLGKAAGIGDGDKLSDLV